MIFVFNVQSEIQSASIHVNHCLNFSILLPKIIHFLYLRLNLIYPPDSIFISFLSTTISFYLFAIQIHAYLFQSRFNYLCLFLYIHLYLFLSLVYSPLSLFIACIFSSISFYLFVNPNSRPSLSIPLSLSLSILLISTYISFYHLSIHLCFFIPLSQSRFMPISFYPFVNSNSRLYLSNPFS